MIYDAENRLVEVKKNNVTTAQFTFDGDGKRVKSVIGAETILFAGSHYEKKGSTITKYYFAGASRIAMRKYTIPQNMTVEYFLGDHLGSTSITTDNAGVKVSEMRYKPWGELRYSWTNAPANTSPTYELTKYQFTGQYSYNTEFGLHFYGARFYDSSLGRFIQADSIVPGGVQGLDRYAYVNNAPTRFTDPSGHRACEDSMDCENSEPTWRYSDPQYWTALIKNEFGIKMSNKGEKSWDFRNLVLMYYSLQNINTALNGKLKSIIGSSTFTMGEYHPTADCPTCTYSGWTSGTSIMFYTMGNAAIRQMNIYHEFGHVLDNLPGMIDVFSTNSNINSPDFITDTGYLNTNALVSTSNNAIQHPYSILDDPTIGAQEHWADIFANYVAGNIDKSKPNGIAMYNFVTGALAPYIGVP